MRRKGLTQSELAWRLGVQPQSVHAVLKGARGKQPKSLLDILNVLDLELAVRPKVIQEPAWQALAGLCTDPDAPTDMSINHDQYIDEALADEYEESIRGKR